MAVKSCLGDNIGMFITELDTLNPAVQLVKPNVERDAPIAVEWLAGEKGRNTLRLMGVAEADIRPTTLGQESKRVQEFLDKSDQYNWMIQLDKSIVGSIWVELHTNGEVAAPALSIMLGDESARGHGVGQAAMQAVIEFLHKQGHAEIYSRHLTRNLTSASLLNKLNFQNDGEPYTSSADGLDWQNLVLKTNRDRG